MNAQLDEQETVVEALVQRYEQMLGVAQQRHEAVRRADPALVTATVEHERTLAQEVAQLESQRAQIVRGLAIALSSDAGEKTTISWIGQRVGGERGERLLRTAAQLRTKLERVQTENEIVRRALMHLASHMEGLWRQVATVLNHARTYGRAGMVEPGPRVVSAVDVTS